MRPWAYAIFAASLIAVSDVANGGIVFLTGNNPQPDEENVFLNAGTTGSTVFGLTNQSGIGLSFSSTTNTLAEPTNGQARIEDAAGGLLNDITVSVLGGFSMDYILNPFNGSGTATLTAIMNEPGGGTQTFTFDYLLGNGNNFVTAFASGGESIRSLNISAPSGFEALQQPRISGAALIAIGEPATLALLGLALAAIGVVLYRRN